MTTLRELLGQQALELHRALLASWQIAEHDWIPTLNMDGESHAGAPHLHDVEEWLDRVAEACRPRWSAYGSQPFGLNPMEIYILLASALFHDIGRGRVRKQNSKEERPHGEVSREILNEHWAQLGIVDGRIAHEIGLICEYHTDKEGCWRHHDVTQIHPWGMVHTEALAALLTLADELDTAYTRAAPAYMKDKRLSLAGGGDIKPEILDRMEDELLTKGLYRESIGSVEMDPGAHLIKTVLFAHHLPGPMEGGQANPRADEWLKWNAAPEAVPETFTVDDFFFSFLEALSTHTTGDPRAFLARQYYRASDFRHVDILGRLRFPPGSPDPDDLMRHTFLWDRQARVIRPVRVKGTLRAVEDLEATLDLVSRTVDRVGKRAGNKRVALSNLDAFRGSVVRVLRKVACALWSAQKCREAVDDEMRKGAEVTERELLRYAGCQDIPKEGLDEISAWGQTAPNSKSGNWWAKDTPWWQLSVWTMVTVADRLECKPDGHPPWQPATVRDLHEILIVLMHALTFLDLGQGRQPSGTRANSIGELEPRPRLEIWSVEDYHANLLHAFQFYLRCVRELLNLPFFDSERLLRDREDDPSAREEPAECARERLQNLWDSLSRGTPGGLLAPRGDKPPDASDLPRWDGLNALECTVKEVIRLWRGKHRQHGGLKAEDLAYAIRFMFMRWLQDDVRDKNEKLRRLHSGLSKLDIPFTDWMIEYSNQLFDHEWRVRIEPSLKGESLGVMFQEALALWRGVQTRDQQIPWDSLAAQVREPKRERVRSAAMRLNNLLFLYESHRRRPGETKADASPPQPHFWDFMAAQCLWAKNPARDDRDGPVRLRTGSSGWSIGGRTPTADEQKRIIEFLRRFDRRLSEPRDA